MCTNTPQKINDFFIMSKIGGVPTLSSIPGISGLGTSTTSRITQSDTSPNKSIKYPTPITKPTKHVSINNTDNNSSLDTISDHLKTISIGFEKLTQHLCNKNMNSENSDKNIVQFLNDIDDLLTENSVIVICKNPFNRNDVSKIIEKNSSDIGNLNITSYDSISSAVKNITPTPDVNTIINKINTTTL